jgi:KaiC/GvpD/RAD55 family RecA-like ATPase
VAKQKAESKGPSTVAQTRSVTVPGPEDLEHAKDDALLQLRIGRSAHFYTVVISALLAVDAILFLYFQPPIRDLHPHSWSTSFYVLLPIVAGVALAAVGLAAKWEEYFLWPWEAHFSVSVGALVVNVLLLLVTVLHVVGYGAFGRLTLWPWIYPAALAGISLGLIGLVLTWSGWTNRQWASAIAAVLPVATALVLLFPPRGGSTLDDLLATSLFISAIFYQSSGSFLHLISSGTRPHERELITTGQTRMFRLAEELRGKEEALHFREAALVKREAAAENDELSIQRQNEALTEARAQLDELEKDYRDRSDAVMAKEREWVGKTAAIDGQSRQIEDRGKALELREQEVARATPQISAREGRVVEREGELTKREVELNQRQADLDRRAAALPEVEARLETRKKELDQKTNDLLRREGEITARETAAGGAATPAAAQDLASREVKLQQFKAVLDEQNIALGRKARENQERAKTIEVALKTSVAKEGELATREATLRQKEADLADRVKAADERRAQYETAAKEVESRLGEVAQTQVSTAQQKSDLDRTGKTLADREAALAAREARLQGRGTELDARESRLNARERALSADEAEVGLRRQEIARGSDLPIAGLAAVAAADSRDAPPARRRGGAVGVRDIAQESTPVEETLRPSVGRRIADRLPTGTSRLDDLLLGGLPPKAHVVVVGDPFVGKEVVVYSFIAEGLKRGEPAILVTAARPPSEVTESLGIVLPQFREYEQMGMVTWIDASGQPAARPSDPQRVSARGSDDRAGILSALVKSAKSIEEDRKLPFRVGFLGLSAVLAHTDERAGFSFLQNVVGILKPRNALAMYTLESGAISDAQVETLLGRMDGAIAFRQDRDRTFLSVKGLGDVQTRDWIECRATNRALIVGSFALERIR